jgi:hypothetical protein
MVATLSTGRKNEKKCQHRQGNFTMIQNSRLVLILLHFSWISLYLACHVVDSGAILTA